MFQNCMPNFSTSHGIYMFVAPLMWLQHQPINFLHKLKRLYIILSKCEMIRLFKHSQHLLLYNRCGFKIDAPNFVATNETWWPSDKLCMVAGCGVQWRTPLSSSPSPRVRPTWTATTWVGLRRLPTPTLQLRLPAVPSSTTPIPRPLIWVRVLHVCDLKPKSSILLCSTRPTDRTKCRSDAEKLICRRIWMRCEYRNTVGWFFCVAHVQAIICALFLLLVKKLLSSRRLYQTYWAAN